MKNKKKIIIILIIAIVAVALVFLYRNIKYNVVFTLNGEKNMVVEFGSSYTDPGFVAKNGFGKDISSSVTANIPVNTLLMDTYEITYELNYGNVKKNLSRTVTVDLLDMDKLNIVLNGEEIIYILKDSIYDEEGAYVINKVNNENFNLGNMNIDNNIDVHKIGTYTVNYTYTYNEKSISKTRKVEVFDILYNISPTTLTTNKVNIKLDLESINNYSNTKLPDGTSSLYKNIEYEVTKNGDYTFIITTKNNKKYEKTITIDNIIDNYKCTGKITSNGTTISVSPTSDNVKGYEWLINNKITTGTSTYEEYKIINNAKVNLSFANGQKYQVNCLIEDKLLYHFKYDLENTGTWTKPEIKCDTYSAQDRTKYDKMLKQAIEEAGGKGTRGGVVAAARFLVGGLDYRIRYQGPKTTDSRIGKYAHEGLNIGNSNAWGCRVGGYTQGLDCTHFIEWVLYQNGITKAPYSFSQTETSKVIDKLKPGDLLYVKCGKSCSNPSAGLSHVAIIAGIDREKQIYYIAESVPGKDGKLGVTLHAYKRTTVLSTFKAVGNISFKGEGNVNDMWLME